MAKVSKYDGTMVKVGLRMERVDKGAPVPELADAEHVKLLEERGMVADGEVLAGLTHETHGPAPFDVDEDAEGGVKSRVVNNPKRS
jgi:hypothetical protein